MKNEGIYIQNKPSQQAHESRDKKGKARGDESKAKKKQLWDK